MFSDLMPNYQVTLTDWDIDVLDSALFLMQEQMRNSATPQFFDGLLAKTDELISMLENVRTWRGTSI